MPVCIATSATPGSPSSAIMSPTAKTSGWPGREQSGSTCDPAGAVALGAARLGQQPRERRRRDARSPDLRPRRVPRHGAVGALHFDAALVDADDDGARVDLDPRLPELARPALGEPVAEGGEDLVAAVEQEHADLLRVEAAEVAVERAARELGDLTRDLDAGRPAADRDERQPFGPQLRVLLELRALERAEDPHPQLEGIRERLDPGSERRNSSCPKYDCPTPAATTRLS